MLDRFEKDHRCLTELADRMEAPIRSGPSRREAAQELRCGLAHEGVRHTSIEDRLVYRRPDEGDPQRVAQQRECFPCVRTDQFSFQL